MVPKLWSLRKLGDVAEVLGGGTPRKEEKGHWAGPIPWVTPSEVSNLRTRFIIATARKLSLAGLAASAAKLLPAGSVLMTSRATIGACAIAAQPMATNQGFQNLVPRSAVTSEFLFYVAQSLRPRLMQLASGSTFLEVSRNSVRGVEILVPPLDEQRKIATILSSVDDTIERSQAVIEQLQGVKKAMTKELLTKGIPGRHSYFKITPAGKIPVDWEALPLSELAQVERGKFDHRPRNDARFYGGPYPFIQTGDVARCGGHITASTQSLNERGIAISKLFPAGTIVMTIAAHIGDTGILDIDVALPDSLVGISAGKRLDNRFLELALRLKKAELERSATQNAQKNINLQVIRPLPIQVPSIEEQKSISTVIDTISERLRAEIGFVEQLVAVKSAFLHSLLSGQIRVKPDETAS